MRPIAAAVAEDAPALAPGVLQKASARIGMGEKSRELYICRASVVTVDVSQEGSQVTGRKGLPKAASRLCRTRHSDASS
jgi:hypothetical protein